VDRIRALLALTLAGICFSSSAQASESLKFAVSLKPEHLGEGTTVGFDFKIIPHTGLVPPPLTEVDMRYPGDLGIGLSGLGLATCSVRRLEVRGVEGCAAEARMGYGSVLAEIAIGGEVIQEHATLDVLRATTQQGHISMYFYAQGTTPVQDEVVFPGALLPAPRPFGGRLHIHVPLVPTFTEGPFVSVAQIHGTLGPKHLTYFRHIRHRFIPYNPQGILLPRHCPRGGFRFTAALTFLDGTRTSASAAVPCPHRRP
jgi:hypothetical protein